MRTLLATIALFLLTPTLRAQQLPASFGKEATRGEVVVYPTQAEATAGERSSKYLTRLEGWTREGNRFTTPFTVPFSWANLQVLFHISAATADYEVYVNGKQVAYNANSCNPAEFNITRAVHEGRNTLEVVLSNPSPLAPLESWREESAQAAIGQTWVMSQPTMYIRDYYARTWLSDTTAMAEITVVVKSGALNPRTSRVYCELLAPSGEQVLFDHKELTLDMRREDTLRFLTPIPKNLLWSDELPTRYTLRLRTQHEGRYGEYIEAKVGFRALEWREGRLLLNGQPVTLRTAEVAPYIQPQELALLREQGYNTLRVKAGAEVPGFYNTCDEMGLMVIAQAPLNTSRSGNSRRKGGNPTNDPRWKGAYIERTTDSYYSARRHCSVIAFSLAENSSNGTNLYDSYLTMKQLGDERPVIYPAAEGEWNTDLVVTE